MQDTVELVRGLSDSQVIEVVKELFNSIYTNVSYDEVLNNSKAVAEVAQLVSLDDEVLQQELSAHDSARFGRLVLEQFARDPELAAVVEQAWKKVQSSDELIVDVLLALGLVVNLTLFMATTKVELKKGSDGKIHWNIVKGRAGPDLIRSIINPLVKTAKPSDG